MTDNERTIVKIMGYISMVLNMMGVTILSFLGESLFMWSVWIAGSSLAIYYNGLKKDKPMFLLFAFYSVMNIIGIFRMIGLITL